jgi:hypothetical protein
MLEFIHNDPEFEELIYIVLKVSVLSEVGINRSAKPPFVFIPI